MSNSSGDEIIICHHLDVHITENNFGSVVSDTILCFLNLLLAFISVTSNALVIRVYLKTSSVKTPANILLVLVSSLELAKATFSQPAFIVWRISEITRQDHCFVYIFTVLTNNFCSASSLLTTCFLITIERYLSVFRPILHRKPIVNRAFTISIPIMLTTVATFLLAMFFTSQDQIYFTVIYIIVFTCLTATAVVYLKIRAKMRQMPPGVANDVRMASKVSADRKMNNTVITIIIVSLACYFPLFVVLIYISLHKRTKWRTQYIIPWAYMLMFCTAALNPFIYCWKNRRLRTEMLKITKKVLRSKQRHFNNNASSNTSTQQASSIETNL